MEIKYDFEGLKEMNNFLHRHFLGFGIKIQGIRYELKSRNIWLKILGDLEFDETWPTTSVVHLIEGKSKFQTKVGQEFEIPLKLEFLIGSTIVWNLNLIFKCHFWV
jgi:hypothetical protein